MWSGDPVIREFLSPTLSLHLTFFFKRLIIFGLNLVSLSTSRCISKSVIVSMFISWDYFIK